MSRNSEEINWVWRCSLDDEVGEDFYDYGSKLETGVTGDPLRNIGAFLQLD